MRQGHPHLKLDGSEQDAFYCRNIYGKKAGTMSWIKHKFWRRVRGKDRASLAGGALLVSLEVDYLSPEEDV